MAASLARSRASLVVAPARLGVGAERLHVEVDGVRVGMGARDGGLAGGDQQHRQEQDGDEYKHDRCDG
jgi:hypothetical protein